MAISKITAFLCDRCGAKAEVAEGRNNDWRRVSRDTYMCDFQDLCPSCGESFERWWQQAVRLAAAEETVNKQVSRASNATHSAA